MATILDSICVPAMKETECWPKNGKSPSELKDTLRRPKLFSIAAAQVEVKAKVPSNQKVASHRVNPATVLKLKDPKLFSM